MPGGVVGTLPWDTLSLGGIAAMLTVTLIRMVVSGRFVPRDQVDMLMSDARDRIRYMETAAKADAETRADLVKQNEKLSMQGELTLALLRALQAPTGAANSGSGHVATTQE